MARVPLPLLMAWRTYLRIRDEVVVTRSRAQAVRSRGPSLVPKYSVVSAVYNVEKYVDQFVRSIVVQPEFVDQIQLIVVNDGSTDGSLQLLRKWQRRFPKNIIVVDQENAGQSAAQNHGLKFATGTWITFTDADDFLERNYFGRVSSFIQQHDYSKYPLNFVATNLILFHERQGRFQDGHPLRWRFRNNAVVPISNTGNYFHIHSSSTFFRRSIIAKHGLGFDPRVVPVFQDGYFTARFIMACDTGRIGFCKSARYYYRKRADASSTVDTSHHKVSRFDDVYRFGHLPLLREATARFGSAPVWLQRMVLYDIMWEIRRLVDNRSALAFLTGEQRQTFAELLTETMHYIDAQTIASFELAGAQDLHRVGLVSLYKSLQEQQPRAWAESVDLVSNTCVLRWYDPPAGRAVSITMDGVPLQPLETKDQLHTFMGAPFVVEKRARVKASGGYLSIYLDDEPALIKAASYPWSECVELAAPLATAAEPRPPNGLPVKIAKLRNLARTTAVRSKYQSAWILMDRDVQADDNAEHLYRHLMAARPTVNAFFVLRRNSHDWPRLEREGFRLIEFGSNEHACALLNADFLISSHIDNYVTQYLPARHFGDLLRYKYVFLQHGVTQHDLSKWLNTKPISLMCTSTRAEHEAIGGTANSYKLMPSEVALTGFPRHDRLLARAGESRRRILLMPTWRESVVGKPIGKSNRRSMNPAFAASEFARAWKSLLRSERLHSLLATHGFEAVFFPHANIEMYLPLFDIPEHITVERHSEGNLIQDSFAKARVLVTDYSSVAFEMAYLERSIVYYQFDRESVITGAHLIREGYFDFERDGFGPVCRNEEDVLDMIEHTMAQDGRSDPMYVKRATDTFAWRDGKCSERVVAAIEGLTRWPVVTRAPAHQIREPAE